MLRAQLLFAIAEYGDAVDDYERILSLTTGLNMTRRAYEGLIRAEARREKIQRLVKHMKDSKMTTLELAALAEQDDALQRAMRHKRVQTFLAKRREEERPK